LEGIQVAHWSTLGAPDAPAEAIMAFARAEDYVVLTHGQDFSSILAASQENKPSVEQIRADDSRPERIGGIVVLALSQTWDELEVVQALGQTQDELETMALLTIDMLRTRVRLLPLLVRVKFPLPYGLKIL
jgi:predicted nuclease of predicted toxin-antitoxin system